MNFAVARQPFRAIVLFSALALGAALPHQYLWRPELSAFCLAQKLLLALIIVLGVMGTYGRFSQFIGGMIVIPGLAGMLLSFEQLQMQQAPQVMMPGCLPPLNYLMDTLSLAELVTAVFSINGECAGIHPDIIGISVPVWSLGLFAGVSVAGGFLVFSKKKT